MIALLILVGVVLRLAGILGPVSGAGRDRPKEAAAKTVDVLGGRLRFDDVPRQSKEFIGYYRTIQLTPEQEAIKMEVLGARPAACCRDSNALTCCCTCNLSKTVWGLSNYAIATHHVDARELEQVVDGWLSFVNPSGYSGDTCYTGGCARGFAAKGCGGMSEDALTM